MKRITLIFFILFLSFKGIFSQVKTDSIPPLEIKSSFFANIFTGFYYSTNKNIKPKAGFEFSTGLIGYRADWGKKASATLIYDVTRTTSDIVVTDSNNTVHNVSLFKGSDYTAFLKMAQIDFRPYEWLEISAGQMLNQQYLTFQDKFWGFRYVATTFQELYRFGSPADFGLRITGKYKNKLNFTLGSVNGEGPFRKQDVDAGFQYFSNIEWMPFKGFTAKFYGDIFPINNKSTRGTLSFFTGYKSDNWRLGVELNHIENYGNVKGKSWDGVSTYGAYKISKGWHILLRHDYLIETATYKNEHYIIGGCEYEPYKNLFVSLNGRYLTAGEVPWVYFNLGAKF